MQCQQSCWMRLCADMAYLLSSTVIRGKPTCMHWSYEEAVYTFRNQSGMNFFIPPIGQLTHWAFNHGVETMLAKTVKENEKDWDAQLLKALLVCRTALHESTGFNPYHLNFEMSPKLPIDVTLGHIPREGRWRTLQLPTYYINVCTSSYAWHILLCGNITSQPSIMKVDLWCKQCRWDLRNWLYKVYPTVNREELANCPLCGKYPIAWLTCEWIRVLS